MSIADRWARLYAEPDDQCLGSVLQEYRATGPERRGLVVGWELQ